MRLEDDGPGSWELRRNSGDDERVRELARRIGAGEHDLARELADLLDAGSAPKPIWVSSVLARIKHGYSLEVGRIADIVARAVESGAIQPGNELALDRRIADEVHEVVRADARGIVIATDCLPDIIGQRLPRDRLTSGNDIAWHDIATHALTYDVESRLYELGIDHRDPRPGQGRATCEECRSRISLDDEGAWAHDDSTAAHFARPAGQLLSQHPSWAEGQWDEDEVRFAEWAIRLIGRVGVPLERATVSSLLRSFDACASNQTVPADDRLRARYLAARLRGGSLPLYAGRADPHCETCIRIGDRPCAAHASRTEGRGRGRRRGRRQT